MKLTRIDLNSTNFCFCPDTGIQFWANSSAASTVSILGNAAILLGGLYLLSRSDEVFHLDVTNYIFLLEVIALKDAESAIQELQTAFEAGYNRWLDSDESTLETVQQELTDQVRKKSENQNRSQGTYVETFTASSRVTRRARLPRAGE